ncbi:Periplasmic binding protein [uncultured Alphaproteobacteria bacterium]|uniref:Periplasmic binding protein n=1 Tax=uncultured Alphaproteobacteria bacterium TaxID=91750 RepID=A0A212J143_9PROT|nr:Periplasmic binding protein [uncultured Alphaproteobacteria bacterium]
MRGRGLALAAAVALATMATADARAEERIVSLGGSLTETVAALGLGDAIVGVDQSSLRPPEVAKRAPRVGSPRAVPLEAILAVSPTVVVAYDDLDPPGVLPGLRGLGVRVVTVPRRPDVDTARRKVLAIAEGLGVPERGRHLLAEIDRDLAWPEAKPRPARKVRVLFVQSMGSGPLMISGTGTSAAALMEAAGVENAVTAFAGYRPLNAEAALAVDPEAIVILKRALERIGGLSGLAATPGLGDTKAVRENRVVVSDDAAFLGLGPGLGKAVRDLREAVYGE